MLILDYENKQNFVKYTGNLIPVSKFHPNLKTIFYCKLFIHLKAVSEIALQVSWTKFQLLQQKSGMRSKDY